MAGDDTPGTGLLEKLSGGLEHDLLRDALVQPMSPVGAPDPGDYATVAFHLLLMGALATALLLWRDSGPALRHTRWLVAGFALAFLATAWTALAGLTDPFIIDQMVVSVDGNTGKNLTLLYHLFHPEPVRTSLIAVVRHLSGADGLPPMVTVARLSFLCSVASLLGLVLAGILCRAGLAVTVMAIGAWGLSSLFLVNAFSDSPLPFVAFYAAGVHLAGAVMMDRRAPLLPRAAALLPFIGFQFLVADMRPELLVVWIPADALLLASWVSRQGPTDLVERLAEGLFGFARLVAGHWKRMALVLPVVAVVLIAPALLVKAPFSLYDEPRTAQCFPFFLSTVLWGYFVPTLARMAFWVTPALFLFLVAGLLWSLVRPRVMLGAGLGVAAVLSAHWMLALSHTEFNFIRVVGPVVPVLVLLGLSAAGSWNRNQRLLAAGLCGAVLLSSYGMPDTLHWAGEPSRGLEHPLSGQDNVGEARFVSRYLSQNPGVCLIAPVLVDEYYGRDEVPRHRQLVDLLVLRNGSAVRFGKALGTADHPQLMEAVRAVASGCRESRVYLGLDCTLQGVTYCDALRPHLAYHLGENFQGPQYSAPRYGRRTLRRDIGAYFINDPSVGPPSVVPSEDR